MCIQTETTYLGPSKGSLTTLIRQYGSSFHESPEEISAQEKTTKAYGTRKKSLMNFLYENDIPLEITSSLIYQWDNTQSSQDYVITRWYDYIEDERQKLFDDEKNRCKQRSEETGLPLSFFITEMDDPNVFDTDVNDNNSDEQLWDEDDQYTYDHDEHNSNAIFDEDGFEIVLRKK